MSIIHRIVEGEGWEAGLIIGLRKAKEFARIDPDGSFQTRFPVGDAMVYVKQLGRIQWVKVVGDGGYFEFFTSGKPVETIVTAGTIVPFTAYKAAVVCVDVGTATAIIGNGQKSEFTIPNSPLGRPAQVGLIDEPVSYPQPKSLLYESYAPLSPHTGVWLRSYADVSTFTGPFSTAAREPRADRGPVSPFTLRDIDFDIPLLYGAGKAKASRAYLNGDGVDWPRANGLQNVTSDNFGSRTFAIYNDAFGQFFFFPLAAISPESMPPLQNVDNAMVQKFRPDLPAWCFTSSQMARQWWDDQGAAGAVDFPDIDWKFSHDGKRACAVVFERKAAVRDAAYLDDPATLGVTPVDGMQFNAYQDYFTGALGKFGATYFPSHSPDRFSIAPGVLELTFAIVLTGPDLGQFSVSITVDEIRRPTTNEYFTVLAGYSWVDIKAEDFTPENQHFEAKKGDLVVLDLERHYKATSVIPHFSQGPTAHFLSLKNLTAERELRAFPAFRSIVTPVDGVATATETHEYVQGYRLVDFDLPTLSFVLRIEFMSQYAATVPALAGGPASQTYRVEHFGLSVYTLNRLRETVYPETIGAYAKTELDFRKASSGRSAVEGFTRLPLNLVDGWSNADYSKYRDWYLESAFAKDFTPDAPQPSNAILGLFEVGFAQGLGDGPNRGPCYLTDPCFGWNAYGQTFIDINHLTEQSTFFAHPNGAWALYDQQYVYNRTGIPDRPGDGVVTTNTYDPLDVTTFEHCILDRVHFQKSDTTFRALYNKAVAKGVLDETLHADLRPIDLTDLRATFGKNPIASTGTTAAMIGVSWGGKTGYYLEGTYMKAAGNTSVQFGNQYGWMAPALGDFFSAAADGSGRTDFFAATPIKFSSPVLL